MKGSGGDDGRVVGEEHATARRAADLHVQLPGALPTMSRSALRGGCGSETWGRWGAVRRRPVRDGVGAAGRGGRVAGGGRGAPAPGVAEVPVSRRHGDGLHLPLCAHGAGGVAVGGAEAAGACGAADARGGVARAGESR